MTQRDDTTQHQRRKTEAENAFIRRFRKAPEKASEGDLPEEEVPSSMAAHVGEEYGFRPRTQKLRGWGGLKGKSRVAKSVNQVLHSTIHTHPARCGPDALVLGLIIDVFL